MGHIWGQLERNSITMKEIIIEKGKTNKEICKDIRTSA